jgi:hypothetical protein
VHAEHEVRLVLAEDVDVVGPPEHDPAAVQIAQQFDDREEDLCSQGAALDAVVEVHAAPVDDRRFLEHLLDAHVDLVPVELEAPLRKRLRAGVVAAAGAGGEDEDANLAMQVADQGG